MALCSEILLNRNILTLQRSISALQPEKLQPGTPASVSTTAVTATGLVCDSAPLPPALLHHYISELTQETQSNRQLNMPPFYSQ